APAVTGHFLVIQPKAGDGSFPLSPVPARIDFAMRVAGSICVYAVLAWQAAAAAPPASVAGRVVDENGVAVAGARVEVSSGATTVTANSDSAGNFNLEVPSPGEYEIRAECLGFFVYSGKSVAFQEGLNRLTITLN